MIEHNDDGRWKDGQVKWVENEEMVLEETRGRVKELTKVSDARNSKGRQVFFFFSCEAVLNYETAHSGGSGAQETNYLDPMKHDWKAVSKILQLAGHKEKSYIHDLYVCTTKWA